MTDTHDIPDFKSQISNSNGGDAHLETDQQIRREAASGSVFANRKRLWSLGLLMIAVVAVVAWFRAGMLDLPAAPAGLTLDASGLTGLEEMKQLNAAIWPEELGPGSSTSAPALSEAASLVRRGVAAFRLGDTRAALDYMRQGIRLDPSNLVLNNAYRRVAFRSRRDFLRSARQKSMLTPQFPPELDRQPIAFFEELDRLHSTRETKLNLALSWVDEMLLFPALEIKAPSSVQAVDLLTEVLDNGHPGYIPALLGRGLNYLHRPSRLVWPESSTTSRDAAVQDIGKCVAIGRKFDKGSPRLHATLAMMLGDAYVKADRPSVARSWWQIAQNLCRDDDMQAAIRRRYAWGDEEILDQLEEELDRGRGELDHPMTDLAWVWD